MSKFNEEKCEEIAHKVYDLLSKAVDDGVLNLSEIESEHHGNELTMGCVDAVGMFIMSLTGVQSDRLDFNQTVNTLIYQAKQVENE